MLVPGLEYNFETLVECVSDLGIADQIRVFVVHDPFPPNVLNSRRNVTKNQGNFFVRILAVKFLILLCFKFKHNGDVSLSNIFRQCIVFTSRCKEGKPVKL